MIEISLQVEELSGKKTNVGLIFMKKKKRRNVKKHGRLFLVRSRRKRNNKNEITRYKARLVAKGFTQKEGIDYHETFSPVSKKDSLRIIMALVAHFDLELHQMDVRTVFLNRNLEEEVYMKKPEGFV